MSKMMSSPEPMSLGSPTQSPGSQLAGGSAGNPYLPQFLLGDIAPNSQLLNQRNSSQNNSKYWQGGSSPPRSSNLYGGPSVGSGSGSGSVSNSGSIARSYSITGYDTKLNNSNLLLEKNEPNYHFNHSSYQSYSPHQHERLIGSTTIMSGNLMMGSQHHSSHHHHHHQSGLNMSSNQTLNQNSNAANSQQQQPGAPPINRLVDMLNKTSFTPGSNFHTPNDTSSRNNLPGSNKFTSADFYSNNSLTVDSKPDLAFTPGASSNLLAQNRLATSPPSPTQIDPFYNYGDSIKLDEKLDGTWITIFGFPPSATSYVLQEFSVYGQIVKHVPSSQGNWLHIQYQTKLQAQKALSKNGKILSNSLMVGVMPCIDKKVMYGSSPNTPAIDTSLSSDVGNLSQSQQLPSSASSNKITKASFAHNGSKLDRTQSLRTGIRPLGAFNRNLDGPNTNGAADDDSKLPKKNVNVISKAMEYMFGW